MSNRNWSVEQLVNYIKNRLENDSYLSSLWVKGEISNFIHHSSGHFYFTLKDEKASIPCVMFNSYTRKLNFLVKDGTKVIVNAKVSLYEKTGKLQLYVTDMKEDGMGDLYQRFELLKRKLYQEGYFNSEHKKPLPPYPFSIALISGKDTAANSDVHITLRRRWPVAKITDYYSLVQGDAAVRNIVEQIRNADSHSHDVIILARGGGSLEDLWCFNEEEVVKAIYSCRTPIITGIGHEVDFTLSDFAADVRANTPTGAAELVAPKLTDVRTQIEQHRSMLENHIVARLEKERKDVDNRIFYQLPKLAQGIIQKPALELMMLSQELSKVPAQLSQRYSFDLFSCRASLENYPKSFNQQKQKVAIKSRTLIHKGELFLQTSKYQLDMNCDRIKKAEEEKIGGSKYSLEKLTSLLNALSPLEVLKRGYAIVEKDSAVIKDASMLSLSDEVSIHLAKGDLSAVVTGKKE